MGSGCIGLLASVCIEARWRQAKLWASYNARQARFWCLTCWDLCFKLQDLRGGASRGGGGGSSGSGSGGGTSSSSRTSSKQQQQQK